MRFYGAEAMQLQGLKNRRCIEHMQKALPGFAMRPKAAIVGVTYSGTAYLRQTFDASPNIIAFPAIPRAEVFKSANEPPYGLLYFPYLVWLYRQGLWWPEDRLLREMLLSAADNTIKEMEGRWNKLNSTAVIPVLFDSYGFAGNEMSVEAFHSPWYYDSTVKLIVVMRNPTDALYAAYRSRWLESHFGRSFEEEMKISRISSILSMPKKPPFWEVFGMLPWQYGRSCFKNMLEMWMEKFPPENIYIIPNTEMDNNRDIVFRGLADMLDIPELTPIPDTQQLERTYPGTIDFPSMKEETREILDEFFALYNDGIDELAARCHVLGDSSALLKRIPLRHGRMQSESSVPAFPEETYLASSADAIAACDVAGMIRFAEALFVCGTDHARRKAARTLFSLAYAANLPGYACSALELLRSAGEKERVLRIYAAALGLQVLGEGGGRLPVCA